AARDRIDQTAVAARRRRRLCEQVRAQRMESRLKERPQDPRQEQQAERHRDERHHEVEAIDEQTARIETGHGDERYAITCGGPRLSRAAEAEASRAPAR